LKKPIPFRTDETTIRSIGEQTMRKMIALTITLLLTTVLATAQTAPVEKKVSKPTKAAAAPKADADVQKCISDKLAASKTITGGSAAVSGGEATLTGEAKNAGAKNGAAKTATGCGAKKVTNNITVAAPPAKPPKK
jgi:osmotically-inducible protein OsmY